MNLRSPAPKAGAIAKLRYTSEYLVVIKRKAVQVALVALLQNCRTARSSLALLCFAALPQPPSVCHRQRSASSPKAGAIAKLRYTSEYLVVIKRKAVQVALVALLQNCRTARSSLALLCFAALPQPPSVCHRQRSASSPKAGAIAKLRYTSEYLDLPNNCALSFVDGVILIY